MKIILVHLQFQRPGLAGNDPTPTSIIETDRGWFVLAYEGGRPRGAGDDPTDEMAMIYKIKKGDQDALLGISQHADYERARLISLGRAGLDADSAQLLEKFRRLQDMLALHSLEFIDGAHRMDAEGAALVEAVRAATAASARQRVDYPVGTEAEAIVEIEGVQSGRLIRVLPGNRVRVAGHLEDGRAVFVHSPESTRAIADPSVHFFLDPGPFVKVIEKPPLPPFSHAAEGRFWWVRHRGAWCPARLRFIDASLGFEDTMEVTAFLPLPKGSVVQDTVNAAQFQAKEWGGAIPEPVPPVAL